MTVELNRENLESMRTLLGTASSDVDKLILILGLREMGVYPTAVIASLCRATCAALQAELDMISSMIAKD